MHKQAKAYPSSSLAGTSIQGQREDEEYPRHRVCSSPGAFEDKESPRDLAGTAIRDRIQGRARYCKQEQHNDSSQGSQGATLRQDVTLNKCSSPKLLRIKSSVCVPISSKGIQQEATCLLSRRQCPVDSLTFELNPRKTVIK